MTPTATRREDDVIKSLAGVLKSSCRSGDLVARYGGEEFVILCADCDNASAAARAEQVRKRLADIPQSRMGGRAVTASFGVTEIQPGDTPETMLRRADRALLMAKARGRNTVVQLGTGSATVNGRAKAEDGAPAAAAAAGDVLLQQQLMTAVPMSVAVEKLRGFVADHCAKIVEITDNNVRLRIDDQAAGQRRRRADRVIAFVVDLRFKEERGQRNQPGDDSNAQSPSRARVPRTRILFTIHPKTGRDRRRDDTLARAKEVLVSFRFLPDGHRHGHRWEVG